MTVADKAFLCGVPGGLVDLKKIIQSKCFVLEFLRDSLLLLALVTLKYLAWIWELVVVTSLPKSNKVTTPRKQPTSLCLQEGK
jgi:hypothetical protein